ncbi:hypothetical protein DER44DRAFT_792783 [Fusarium oxysporum]|nr:hypothetical protein DER44DRAFT_792783 [Fusarium oxysporum]
MPVSIAASLCWQFLAAISTIRSRNSRSQCPLAQSWSCSRCAAQLDNPFWNFPTDPLPPLKSQLHMCRHSQRSDSSRWFPRDPHPVLQA